MNDRKGPISEEHFVSMFLFLLNLVTNICFFNYILILNIYLKNARILLKENKIDVYTNVLIFYNKNIYTIYGDF